MTPEQEFLQALNTIFSAAFGFMMMACIIGASISLIAIFLETLSATISYIKFL